MLAAFPGDDRVDQHGARLGLDYRTLLDSLLSHSRIAGKAKHREYDSRGCREQRVVRAHRTSIPVFRAAVVWPSLSLTTTRTMYRPGGTLKLCATLIPELSSTCRDWSRRRSSTTLSMPEI